MSSLYVWAALLAGYAVTVTTFAEQIITSEIHNARQCYKGYIEDWIVLIDARRDLTELSRPGISVQSEEYHGICL